MSGATVGILLQIAACFMTVVAAAWFLSDHQSNGPFCVLALASGFFLGSMML